MSSLTNMSTVQEPTIIIVTSICHNACCMHLFWPLYMYLVIRNLHTFTIFLLFMFMLLLIEYPSETKEDFVYTVRAFFEC